MRNTLPPLRSNDLLGIARNGYVRFDCKYTITTQPEKKTKHKMRYQTINFRAANSDLTQSGVVKSQAVDTAIRAT